MIQLGMWAVALVLLALVFVLWPLLREQGGGSVGARDARADQQRQAMNVDLYQQRCEELKAQLKQGEIQQEQYDALQRELDLELLGGDDEVKAVVGSQGGRVLFLVSGAVLCGFVWFFYQYNGASDDMAITAQIQQKYAADRAAMMAGAEPDKALARKLMTRLESQLEKDPQNLQYRYLLARSATDLQEYTTAINAYRALLAIDESPLVMGELAQLLFVISDNTITPDAAQLIDKTLEKDPNSHVALGLDGIRHYQSSDYAKAITQWEKAIKLLGPSSPGAQSLAAGVLRARSLLAEAGQSPAAGSVAAASSQEAPSNAAAAGDATGGGLKVSVALGEGVQLNPEHTVFIYARAWQGAPMPLAIQRMRVKDLPVDVSLTKAMAMAPGMSIANFAELELVARVSPSGSAMSKPGDWQAAQGPVKNDDFSSVTSLIIQEQLP